VDQIGQHLHIVREDVSLLQAVDRPMTKRAVAA
jgi:hypothetical protein